MKELLPALLLLRGLPGSGKSSLAALLSEKGTWPVYSVDDYFTGAEGQYEFRFEENHLAYKQCLRLTEQSMAEGIRKIIVDNTLTLEWELEPYLSLAAQYGYYVFIATVEKYHDKGNIHGISSEQIQKMALKYNVKLY